MVSHSTSLNSKTFTPGRESTGDYAGAIQHQTSFLDQETLTEELCMYLLSSVPSGHVLHPVLSAVELQLHHHQSLCIKVRQDSQSWHVALLLVFFSSFTLVTDSTTFSAYLEVRAVHELHYLRLLLALQ